MPDFPQGPNLAALQSMQQPLPPGKGIAGGLLQDINFTQCSLSSAAPLKGQIAGPFSWLFTIGTFGGRGGGPNMVSKLGGSVADGFRQCNSAGNQLLAQLASQAAINNPQIQPAQIDTSGRIDHGLGGRLSGPLQIT